MGDELSRQPLPKLDTPVVDGSQASGSQTDGSQTSGSRGSATNAGAAPAVAPPGASNAAVSQALKRTGIPPGPPRGPGQSAVPGAPSPASAADRGTGRNSAAQASPASLPMASLPATPTGTAGAGSPTGPGTATRASGGPAPSEVPSGAPLGASVAGQTAVSTAVSAHRPAWRIALAPSPARVRAPVRLAVPGVGTRWRVELPPEVALRRGALELPATTPGYSAAAAQSEVAGLAARLRATATRRRSKLLEGTLALKATVAAEGEAKKGAAGSAVNEALRSIRAETATARAEIASEANRRKAEATAVVSTKLRELQAATGTRLDEMQASAARWQEDAARQVTTRQEAARAFGVAEGRRAKQAIDAQAETARAAARAKAGGYPKDERGGVQAEAVLTTGEEFAKKLAKPGPDVQAKAEEGGRKLADGFAGAGAKVVDLIGEQSRKLGVEVRGHTVDLEPQFDSIRTNAHSGLDDVASAINTQLDGVEEASRTELTAVLAEVADHIDESVTSINEALDHESIAAAGALDTAAERTAAAVLAAKRPNLAVGRRVVTDAEGSIVATAEQYESGLADVERVTMGSFAQGGAAVARGTARTASGVSKGLGEAAGAGKQALAGVVDAAGKSADAVIEHWAEVVDEAAKGLDAGFDKAVAGLGVELQKGLDEGNAKITAQVDQAIAKNAEPLAQLDTKLGEAAAEARDKYNAPWYNKVGRWLLSALTSFLIALGKFLLVVLVVVLGIIAIVVGIIADIAILVIIGVIILVGVIVYVVYAIIAGIVARVRSANTWWQAIWGVAVGILDITGLPGIVEGLIGHDIVNGRKLTAEEAGSRFGTGLFGLLLWLIPLKFRGARRGGGRPPELPGEKPPPPLAPQVDPGKPTEPGLPAHEGPGEQKVPGEQGSPQEQGQPTKQEDPGEQKVPDEQKDQPKPRAPYRPCFLAGTEVEVSGYSKRIEAIAVGDKVLGADPRPVLTPGLHRVVALHRARTRRVTRIDVGSARIHSTCTHLFHVPGRGWIPAAELRPGDILSDAGGATPHVSAVEQVALEDDAATFDLTVEGVSTYFVRAADYRVLVHNGGPDDFDGTLYWYFGKKPNLRPGDVDGLSTWKTTSRADVDSLMDYRVNVAGRKINDPHGYFTEEQVQDAELVSPATPSEDPLADIMSHHSLRPATAPDYPTDLEEAQMNQLAETLEGMPKAVVKPSDLKC